MELCREPMVPTVPVQHRLLGITIQLHTLLGMKAGDMALHCIALHCIGIMFLGCEVYALEYDFGRYWKEVTPN